MQRTVLGFSGSAASAAAIGWLRKHSGREVVTVTLDIGQGEELAAVREQALGLGAVRAHVIDAREELVRDYLMRALQAGALMDAYALTWPLLAKRLVDIARMESATSIAHAAASEHAALLAVAIRSLDPNLDVIAVPSESTMTNVHSSMTPRDHASVVFPSSTYGVEASVWGRQITGNGTMVDEAFTLTRDLPECPEEAACVDVAFVGGVPVSANGVEMSLTEMLESLETIAGAHGVGRSQAEGAAFEAPAARVLATAHSALERSALGDDFADLKQQLASVYSDAISSGRWFSDVREAIDSFAHVTSARVRGTVRLMLRKGQCTVAGSSVERGTPTGDSPRAVA
jgi:argininosuccinate synthase